MSVPRRFHLAAVTALEGAFARFCQREAAAERRAAAGLLDELLATHEERQRKALAARRTRRTHRVRVLPPRSWIHG